jgi:transcriptional regulator with XRE-family HTH domain
MAKRALRYREAVLNDRIGARITILRNRRKLSARQLAAASGVHVNTIWRIEKGGGCSASTLVEIAGALCVTVNELICKPQRIVGCACIDKKTC